MQDNGVVSDHIHGCFRAEDYIQPHTTWERGARWSAFRSWSTVLVWAGCSKLSRFGLSAMAPHGVGKPDSRAATADQQDR